MESDGEQEIYILESSENQTTTTKRSYECTYCKRGFTNAQALGGHMNIHRKDRAKEKQQNPNNNHQKYHMSQFTNPANWPTKPYFTSQPSGPFIGSSTFPYGYEALNIRTSNKEELLGADLSLKINSARLNNDEDEGLDLELRLGHKI